MVITHNLEAMNAQRQFNIVYTQKAKSTEKLSSGYRINRAADDAAGLSISEKMRRQIRGLTRGVQNVQDGISLCQVADGALNEVHSILGRMTELAVEAANGTNSDGDRGYINDEIQQLKQEMKHIFGNTSFNEKYIWRMPYIPGVERKPNEELDFQTYNVDVAGNVGGVAINNIRYTWNELGLVDKIDETSNTFKEDGTLKTHLDDGELLYLSYKKGETLDNITRHYFWKADQDGITINENASKKISWSTMGIDKSNITKGTYSFDYNGTTISFDIADGDDSIDDVIAGINGDNMSNISWQTVNAGSKMNPAVQVVSGQQPPEITQQNQASLLSPQWTIYADENGMQLKTGGVSDTLVQWKDLIITNGMNNPMVDFGTPSESSSDVTLDNEAVYRYKGDKSGFVLDFKVTDEISKQALIDSLDGANIKKQLNAKMDKVVVEQDGIKVTLLTNQMKLDVQNAIGRDFSTDTTFDVKSSWDGIKYAITIEGTKLDGTKNSVTYEYLYELTEDDLRNDIKNCKSYATTMAINDDDKRRLEKDVSDAEEREGLKRVGETLRSSLDFSEIGNALKKDILATEKSRDSSIATAIQSANSTIASSMSANGFSAISDATIEQLTSDMIEEYLQNKSITKTDIENQLTQNGIDKQVVPESNWDVLLGDILSSITSEGSAIENAKSTCEVMVANLEQEALDKAKKMLTSINTQVVAHKAEITSWGLQNQRSVMSKETVLDMIVDPPMKKLNLQAGPDEDKTIELKWKPLSLGILGMSGLSVESEDLAKVSLATIGRVIDEISEQRASFGAQQNRLEYTVDNENNIVENLTASESRIRDADLEKEMVIYAKHSILEQAGQSLMAQANQSKQGIASLL